MGCCSSVWFWGWCLALLLLSLLFLLSSFRERMAWTGSDIFVEGDPLAVLFVDVEEIFACHVRSASGRYSKEGDDVVACEK